MSPELLKIINSFGLWVVPLTMVSIVIVQAGLFVRLHRVDNPSKPGALSLAGPADS